MKETGSAWPVSAKGVVRTGWVLAAAVLLVASLMGRWGASRAADEIEVEVRSVTIDETSNSPVVVLENRDRRRALPIWIGHFEARAILMEMEGISGPRPLTHDLMKKIVEELEAEVERVVIDDLRDHTYYASIHMRSRGTELRIDSRPSDAIALALRFDKPIFVNGKLLSGEAAVELGTDTEASGIGRLWGLTLQDVNSDLAEVFGLGEVQGVLVSDVAPDAVAREVNRGDVITDLHGESVATLSELEARAKEIENGASVQLGLWRKGAAVRVTFAAGTP